MKNKLLAVVMSSMALLLSVCPVFADEIAVTTTVSSYLIATFQYNTVAYGSLSAGTSNNPAPSQAIAKYNVTMDTNKEWNLTASGTQFSNGGHTFAVSNLKLQANQTASPTFAVGSATALSGSAQTIVGSASNTITRDYHGWFLTIPSGQYATSYTSTITMTYLSA